MSISATALRFDEHTMWVELTDGRTLGVPLAWFPRLLHATPAQREQAERSRVGLHWEDLDEDISVAGLLAGRGDMTRRADQAARRRQGHIAAAIYTLIQTARLNDVDPLADVLARVNDHKITDLAALLPSRWP